MNNWLIYSIITGVLSVISPLANAQETLQEEKTTLPLWASAWPLTSLSQEASQQEKLVLPTLADTSLGQETPQEGKTTKQLLEPLGKVNSAITGRLTTGMIHYKYFTDQPAFNFSDSMPIWGMGANVNLGELITLDGYFQKSDNGYKGHFQDNQNTEGSFNREDWVFNATSGALNKLLNIPSYLPDLRVFGGYKWSKSNVDVLVFTINPQLGRLPISPSGVTFKSTGWFVGGSLSSQPFANEIRISGSLAYGWLTGSYRFSDPTGFGGTSDIKPTQGLKFGIAWNGPIARRLTYTISTDYYNYSMQIQPEKSRPVSNLEEEVYSINFSLNYFWDL